MKRLIDAKVIILLEAILNKLKEKHPIPKETIDNLSSLPYPDHLENVYNPDYVLSTLKSIPYMVRRYNYNLVHPENDDITNGIIRDISYIVDLANDL